MDNQAENTRKMTRGRSEVVRYDLIDKDGKIVGAFDTAGDAAACARVRYPHQEQDEDRSGRGWDIQIQGVD